MSSHKSPEEIKNMDDVETPPPVVEVEQAQQPKRLSKLSKQYDLDGDGELDTVEFAMRDMDKEGLGHVSNEKVYRIMRAQMEANNKLFNMKRIVIVLLCLVVILAVSNLGTAWAAFKLAKDTSIDSDGTMNVKGTDTSVAVVNAEKVFVILTDPNERRKMAEIACPAGSGANEKCFAEKMGIGTVKKTDVNKIYKYIGQNKIIRVQVPNRCDSKNTDTLTIWDSGSFTKSETTTGNGAGLTVSYLKTYMTASPEVWFKFECTTTSDWCSFDYHLVELACSQSDSTCATAMQNAGQSCATVPLGTSCPETYTCSGFNITSQKCDINLSSQGGCTCEDMGSGPTWACMSPSCQACATCADLDKQYMLNGEYCNSNGQVCTNDSTQTCTCTSNSWSCV